MRARFTLVLLLLAAATPAARAHPLPNFRYDRELDVRLHPEKVEVRYVLLVSFWTIFADSQKLFTPAEIEAMGGKMSRVMQCYCEKMGPVLAGNMDARLNGRRLAFRPTRLVVEQDREHAKLRYVFEAPWRIDGGGADNEFAFEDHNYENDVGMVALKVPEVEVLEDKKVLHFKELVEPEDLRRKDPSQYQPGDADRARKASAVFTAPALPPTRIDAPPEPPAPAPPVVMEAQPEDGLRALLARGPKALFDTNFGTGTLLLLAAVFGAFHAFAPGHGKSVAAAFLVGEQGTFRQAVLLGLSTTFAHTGSVILIAGVFYLRYREAVPQDAQHWLGLGGGVLVLVVGLWLFMRRLRGQVDHVHLFSGCTDMCGNHAARPAVPQCRVPPRNARPVVGQPADALRLVPSRNPMSWVRVVLLGIGAGAIPCVDAVLLLMLAVSAGRLAFALPLLVSFSIGLSTVLALVGVSVVLLHRGGRLVSGDRAWLRFLPTASAVLLMGMGLWMARDAWRGLSANAGTAPPRQLSTSN
jgi:ABC-type nickel/cobalt efflux system permease component RcnA